MIVPPAWIRRDSDSGRTWILCLVLSCLLFTATASASPAGEDRAAELVARGDRLFKRARYEKALQVYAKANKVAKAELPEALLGAAQCHEQLDQFPEALETARAVVALDPGRTALFKAQMIRGTSAYKLAVGDSRLDSAVRVLFQALSTKAREGVADAEESQDEGLLLEAKVSFEEALRLSEARRERAVRFKLAEVLSQLGRSQEALEVIERYQAKKPPPVAGVGGPKGAFESVSGDVVPPRKLVYPAPQYTEIARKARVTGVVKLEVQIDELGNVRGARVLRGLPMGLDQAAIEAVMRWKYQPATRDGRPVAVVETVDLHFQMQ